MSKKPNKQDTFEWICRKCNYIHIEKLGFSRLRSENDDLVEKICSQCGEVQQIKLIGLSKANLADSWMDSKCWCCNERKECFSKYNKKIFNKRIKLINKLGFCEDYVFDHSQIKTDNRQVCYEERTFDEIFNKGHLPIYEDDGL